MQVGLIEQIKNLPFVERVELLEEISRSLREEMINNGKSEKPSESFSIKPLSLQPQDKFDFDNIGKLLETVEGDFHK